MIQETNAKAAAAFAATASKHFAQADKCSVAVVRRFYVEKALRFQRFAKAAAERAKADES